MLVLKFLYRFNNQAIICKLVSLRSWYVDFGADSQVSRSHDNGLHARFNFKMLFVQFFGRVKKNPGQICLLNRLK